MTERQKIRRFALSAATAVCLTLPLTAQAIPAAAAPGDNLVRNGTFETTPPLTDRFRMSSVQGLGGRVWWRQSVAGVG
ncbi:hypothetical protein [Streptomyces roseolus]|uniref:hypothetical protein n=1 Tax=Streptomyces roseolus TaxID=67358 RepID=UPI003664A105